MISIIICTYNRALILNNCLSSLLVCKQPSCQYEIILVDNNSNDNTKNVFQNFKDRINIKYIFEEKPGLSIARNTGAKNAKYDWLFYIDDDVMVLDNTLVEVEKSIHKYSFDFFGGIFSPYYVSPKPKWFSQKYSNYCIVGTKEVRNIGLDYIIGCVMVINKKKLIGVGGFSPDLGMVEGNSRYAEESNIEYVFKKKGYKVGFNPFIEVLHLAPSYKFSVLWQLKSQYFIGKDSSKYLTLREFLKRIIWNFCKSTIAPFYYLKPFFIHENYYVENYLIDTLGKWSYTFGILSSKLKP